LRVEADRAAEIALATGYPDTVVLRELLERAALQPVDARVPDVEYMCRGRLENQPGERADEAAVPVVAVLTLVRARGKRGVRRIEHALDRFFHGPGLRRAVIVVEKAHDREFRRHLAHLARTDAVGERDCDSLGRELRLRWRAEAVEVLVDRLASLVRIL